MDNNDFLAGFSGSNTKKQSDENKATERTVKKEGGTNQSSTDLAANKRLADDIVAKAENADKKETNNQKKSPTPSLLSETPNQTNRSTATRPAQSANAIIKAPEHVVTTDKSFHKRKLIKQAIWGGIAVVIALIIFFTMRMLDTIEVPDFTGQDPTSAPLQAFQVNNTTFTVEEVHDLAEAGRIIRQSPEPGTTIRSSASISITVSLGPDLNEIIELPDFHTKNRAQIRTWQEQNQMRSIQFSDEPHPSIPQHEVIRVEFPATSDPDHFRRSDSLRIFVSSGPATVQIGNMVGNDRDEVDTFIENNPAINVELEFVAHSTIAHGNVLAQSVPAGTRLAHGETLTLTLSAGEPVEVPDFSGMRRIDVEALEVAGLTIDIVDLYQEDIAYREFVSQSVDAGEMLIEDRPTVEVVFSRGRPWIDKWGSVQNVERDIADMNDLGANLSVVIHHINSYEARGSIIEQSHYDQRVSLNTTITIRASLGNMDEPEEVEEFDPVTIPDFSGMRRTEVAQAITDREDNLAIRIVDRYSDELRLGQFISQSRRAGSVLTVARPTVDVIFSLGFPWIEEWSTIRTVESDILEFGDRGAPLELVIYEVNHHAPRGTIVWQSHYDQHVALDETITVHVSLGDREAPEDFGEPGIVPNFAGLTRAQAMQLATDTENLTIRIVDRHHDFISLGQFINQSVPAGTTMSGSNRVVNVFFSLAQPWIPDWLGGSIEPVSAFILGLNDNGANITYEICSLPSSHLPTDLENIQRGTIVWRSHYNQRVPLGTRITLGVYDTNVSRICTNLPPVEPAPPAPSPPPTPPREIVISANCTGIVVDGERATLERNEDGFIIIEAGSTPRLPINTLRESIVVNLPNNWIYDVEVELINSVAIAVRVIIIPSVCPL